MEDASRSGRHDGRGEGSLHVIAPALNRHPTATNNPKAPQKNPGPNNLVDAPACSFFQTCCPSLPQNDYIRVHPSF
jgi:hypothetical protein